MNIEELLDVLRETPGDREYAGGLLRIAEGAEPEELLSGFRMAFRFGELSARRGQRLIDEILELRGAHQDDDGPGITNVDRQIKKLEEQLRSTRGDRAPGPALDEIRALETQKEEKEHELDLLNRELEELEEQRERVGTILRDFPT